LRCAFGANARAEILLELLTRRSQPDHGLTALALSEVGYTKRNVALVLEDLVLAGILASTREGNRVRYRVMDPVGMERVLRPIPLTSGRWHLRLPVLATFVDLSLRLRGRDAVVQGIEARKTLERVMPWIISARVTGPAPTATVDTYWMRLQRWLVDNLIAEDVDSGHGISGMIEGTWVGPDQEIQRPDRLSSALLPRVSSSPNDDAELQCLDLVQAPTVEPPNDWIWAVMSTAATYNHSHTMGLNRRDPWHFVTWAFGDQRVYSVEYDEPLPHNRIARLYGKTAAARARDDHPAVQLRLRRVKEEH